MIWCRGSTALTPTLSRFAGVGAIHLTIPRMNLPLPRSGRGRGEGVRQVDSPAGRRLLVQHFGHPAVDDPLAVGARIGGVDGKDVGALEHGREGRLERDLGARRHEVDLVLRELACLLY